MISSDQTRRHYLSGVRPRTIVGKEWWRFCFYFGY